MNVILAREYGFCNGVKRALERLDKALAENPERPVYSIGEIIHNPDVIRRYEEKGVKIVPSVYDINGGVGVVRAHGLPHSVIQEARDKGFSIIDATCPHVRVISRIIEKERDSGTAIYLLGEPEHPEVIAATADFGDRVTVIDHKRFDPSRFAWPVKEAILLSQTTMAEESFLAAAGEFIRHCRKVTVYNTICRSTRERQGSALELAGQVEIMVVVGGKNSSNTRRLAELCATRTETRMIERAEDLNPADFAGKETAGVTAGASTPDDVVALVVKRLSGF